MLIIWGLKFGVGEVIWRMKFRDPKCAICGLEFGVGEIISNISSMPLSKPFS